MKHMMLFLAVLFFGFTVCSLQAQDDRKSATSDQKAMMEYATPGPMHDILKAGEGTWKVHTLMWMKPGDQPQASDGEAESKLVLGGRFLQTQIHGKLMGMDFEGMGYDGYDNALGQYVSTWMDNMGTGIMFAKGVMNQNTKTISYEGKMVNPVTKREDNMSATFTQPDADHQKYDLFANSNGKKFKMLEITYERKK